MTEPRQVRRVTVGAAENEMELSELQAELEFAREFAPGDVEGLLDFVRTASFWVDGEPMADLPSRRLRARLLDPEAELNKWEDRQPGSRVPREERRWLIPGLWPWGTTPLLTGQPKAGKSTVVADLVASLAIPGRRFLHHFEPVELTQDERGYGVTVISAEGAPEDYEREIVRLGVADVGEQSLVTMYHLEAEQLSFDLTDPAVFDEWLLRLGICTMCDGTDDMVPTVIVVDGITAILQNAGMGVERYGLWIAAFRRLQRALGTPNGLVVGHSTLTGGHSLGNTEGSAQSDGLWGYFTANPDNPTAKRRFKVTPRLGGVAIPPTDVVQRDGRLTLVSGAMTTEDGEVLTEGENEPQTPDYAARLLQFVQEHYEAEGQWPTATQLRRAAVPQEHFTETRDRLVEDGLLLKTKLNGRGGGAVFVIPEQDGDLSS